MRINESKRNLLLPALVLGLAVTLPTFAQEPAASSTQAQRPAESATEEPANQDPLETLQLTGEQRAAIRAIRIANRDEQKAINQRLRRAHMALQQVLDEDNPDEALIEQRAKEVGEARAAAVRMAALQEVRIRRILTPAQQAKLREIRLKAQEATERRQQQRIQNQNNERRRARTGATQGNGVAPRRDLPRNNPLRQP